MKMHALLFATVLLAGCSQAPSYPEDTNTAGTEEAKQSAAESAPMASEVPVIADEAAATTKASTTGTVKAVDAAAGKITIAHGPVEALQWPAMTMAFKATPEQIASVQAGQEVRFEFQSQGMEATITRIEPTR